MSDELSRAIALHRAGDADGAEALCRDILSRAPDHVGALQVSSMIAQRAGRSEAAMALLERALVVAPEEPALHNGMGILWSARGMTDRAIAALRRAHELAPESVPIANNLSAAHYGRGGEHFESGRHDEAAAEYREALRLQPTFAKAWNNLGNALRSARRREDLERAAAAYLRATEIEADFAAAWSNLGLALCDLGRADEALPCFRRACELEPGHATAQHMAAALSGAPAPTPPATYIEALFDDYAQSFDEHLCTALGYSAPEGLAVLLRAHSTEVRERALDLGCGTGLVGAHLRPLCRVLEGVDLSPRMIDIARSKSIYDELAVEGIEPFLRRRNDRFDVIAAADVFIYFGDLAPVFELVAARLAPGGLFVFSTETLADGDSVLGKSGRFAQSRDYIERCCRLTGMIVSERRESTLRSNLGDPVMGDLYLVTQIGTSSAMR